MLAGEDNGEPLLPENEAIWNVLLVGKNQWRMSMAGIYALDIGAILAIAQGMGVQPDKDFLLKIAVFEGEALQILNKKSEKEKDEGPCDSHKQAECKIIYGEHFDWACQNCEEMKSGRAGNKAKDND